MIKINSIECGDCIEVLKEIEPNTIDHVISDIPYGISYDEWDVLHENTNSALLGSSPAQQNSGRVFKSRGKPLNGWSKADKKISLEYYEWCRSWTDILFEITKPASSIFIFAGRRYAHRAISAFEDSGFIFKDMIAWNKENASYKAQHISEIYKRRNDIENEIKWNDWRVGNLRPVFEPILWFIKPYKIGGTIADNVIEYGLGAFNESVFLRYQQKSNNLLNFGYNQSDFGLHPTQKPLELMKFLVELVSIEGQTILDMFAGSGTTLLACKQLNRNFIGIEKEICYYKKVIERLKNDKSSNLSFWESF